MAEPILPSEASGGPVRWSAAHHRLHRHLRRHPQLLPPGACLLLAVSGGQDSMAMLGLLRDLQPLHGWTLRLWHGDHGWRPESGLQAEALAAWAASQGLALVGERALVPDGGAADPVAGEQAADDQAAAGGSRDRADGTGPAAEGPGSGNLGGGNREARARQWRYGCLAREALRQGCRHVLTAHTASDRAETVLLNLARGSHRRGLASLRASRPLAAPEAEEQAERHPGANELLLVRPLLLFTRAETARICEQLGLPIWLDPSNDDGQLSRNRVRAAVLPVLEALHPGASLRISAQAERLAAELEQPAELLDLALAALMDGRDPLGRTLARPGLQALSTAGQRRLLQHWLERHTGRSLESEPLEILLGRLAAGRGPGRLMLADRWQLIWERTTLRLVQAAENHG